jgi:hypothetical protein
MNLKLEVNDALDAALLSKVLEPIGLREIDK